MSDAASSNAPATDVAHPRISDADIAEAFREWLNELDDNIELALSAADELAAARTELDVWLR